MWLESTGVQTEKRETKPKKGKQSPERALYVETDTRPCKELHSLIEKLLFWVHIDTADWQYQLKRGAFIMVESVLTISSFWPVGYTGVSEHGLTDFGTRLLDTFSVHWVTIPSFLWSPRQRKMDSRAIVCEVTKCDCSGNRDSAAC